MRDSHQNKQDREDEEADREVDGILASQPWILTNFSHPRTTLMAHRLVVTN